MSPSPLSSSPALSQSSTKFGQESSMSVDDSKTLRKRAVERVKHAATSQDILLFLVAFRILNALSIKTFFQPDEFFQSLEPAWEIAFGAKSGAWITWVCHRRLSCHWQHIDTLRRSGNTSFDPRYTLYYSPQFTGSLVWCRAFCDYLQHGMPTY